MGYARVSLTVEYALDMLCFPADARIVAAGVVDGGRDLVLTLFHPDLKDVAEGCEPSLVRPKFKRQPPAVLVDWGQS